MGQMQQTSVTHVQTTFYYLTIFQIIYSIRYFDPLPMPALIYYYPNSHSAQIIPTLEPHLRKAAVDAYADALRVVFICQAAINVLGFLACLPIQESPLP